MTFVVLCTLVIILFGAAVYILRQAYPRADSLAQSAGCVFLRYALANAQPAIEQADATEADKDVFRRGVDQVRAEYDRQCAPLR